MKTRTRDRGGALLICIVVTVIILGMSGAYLTLSIFSGRKTNNDVSGLQALYAAEAGAADYIHTLNVQEAQAKAAKTTPPTPAPMSVPKSFSGGSYIVPPQGKVGALTVSNPLNYGSNRTDDDSDGAIDETDEKSFVRLEVLGTYGTINRRLEIILSKTAGGVYWNAVFAGNSSATPYTLPFGGPSGNGDRVQGDIYSGGGFQATGGAQLLNEAGTGAGSTVMYATTYTDSATGTNPTYNQGTQNPLDIPRNLAGQTTWEQKAAALRTGSRLDTDGVTRYIDVSYDLATKGSTAGGANGSGRVAGGGLGLGVAQQQIMNVNEPAHIFRRNPTRASSTTEDRTRYYGFTDTAKPDFYMEDPTHSNIYDRTLSPAVNGESQGHGLQLSSTGNNAVYFIDGNMWSSHNGILNFQFVRSSPTQPMRVTIVVKGNVNFTDNLIYPQQMSTQDALAVIAVQDPLMPNKVSTDFANGLSVLKPGLTVSQFVSQYNTWAADARADGQNISNLNPVSNPADRTRAAQEYNRAHGSGNVFFGDPGSGTVDHFEGFMYAENNFYATGLDADASAGSTTKVEVFGNMTAGNQINIVRNTTQGYKPLKVLFDPKIRNGSAMPPALPNTPGYGSGDWFIASWKQIP